LDADNPTGVVAENLFRLVYRHNPLRERLVEVVNRPHQAFSYRDVDLKLLFLLRP